MSVRLPVYSTEPHVLNQRSRTQAFRKIQDNFTRSNSDSKVHDRVRFTLRDAPWRHSSHPSLFSFQFFVKPTRARRQNAEAAQWWLARRDVKDILQKGLKEGNLKLPPYVAL
jgi:hypothetical protein